MAVVLQFVKRSNSEKQSFASDHTAQILIYNGVRHERLETDSDIATDETPTRPATKRRAN
jgi:hypothetical protein